MATETTMRSADGKATIAYYSWPLPGAKATFAICHGLGEHGERYAAFARALREHGYASYALDLRSHGRSSGQRGHIDSWTQWMDDFTQFTELAREQAKTEVIPLGHSFGGIVVGSAVLNGRVKPRRFILSNPAFRPAVKVPAWKLTMGRAASGIAPRLALDNEVNVNVISRDPEIVKAYANDPLVHRKISSRLYTEWLGASADLMSRAAEIEVPFLLLLGTADRLIDPAGGREFYDKASAPGKTLKTLEGRYHEPFNDLGADEVFDMVANWVAETSA